MDTSMERTGWGARSPGAKRLAESSIVESIAGGGAIVLPILGLVGILPITLAAVSFIAIGAGMMMLGGSLGALRSYRRDAAGARGANGRVVDGMSTEILGGVAASALGILTLFHQSPMVTLAFAAIVAGAAIVVGAAASSRLGRHRVGRGPNERDPESLSASVNFAMGADVLVGLAALTLGILVVIGVGAPGVRLTLILVAALALGAGLFLNGTTLGARMVKLLHR